MKPLVTHLLLELRECSPKILNNLDRVRNALVSAANETEVTILDISFHEFNPFGISGIVVIAKSHLTIHTWPEYDYAAVDIFTSGDMINLEIATSFIIKTFGSKAPSIIEMKRGILVRENARSPREPLVSAPA